MTEPMDDFGRKTDPGLDEPGGFTDVLTLLEQFERVPPPAVIGPRAVEAARAVDRMAASRRAALLGDRKAEPSSSSSGKALERTPEKGVVQVKIAPAAGARGFVCRRCRDDLPRDASVYCAACLTPHHLGCHRRGGGCVACGETQVVHAGAARRERRSWVLPVVAAVALAGPAAALAGHALGVLPWTAVAVAPPTEPGASPAVVVTAVALPGPRQDPLHLARAAGPLVLPDPTPERIPWDWRRDRPTTAGDWAMLGEALRVVDRDREAVEAYGKALELRPELAAALAGRALARLASHDLEGAQLDADRATLVAPRDPSGHVARAIVSASEGDVRRASEELETATTLAPDLHCAWALLGETRFVERRYAEALSAHERARALEGPGEAERERRSGSSVGLRRALLLFLADRPAEGQRTLLALDRELEPSPHVTLWRAALVGPVDTARELARGTSDPTTKLLAAVLLGVQPVAPDRGIEGEPGVRATARVFAALCALRCGDEVAARQHLERAVREDDQSSPPAHLARRWLEAGLPSDFGR